MSTSQISRDNISRTRRSRTLREHACGAFMTFLRQLDEMSRELDLRRGFETRIEVRVDAPAHFGERFVARCQRSEDLLFPCLTVSEVFVDERDGIVARLTVCGVDPLRIARPQLRQRAESVAGRGSMPAV